MTICCLGDFTYHAGIAQETYVILLVGVPSSEPRLRDERHQFVRICTSLSEMRCQAGKKIDRHLLGRHLSIAKPPPSPSTVLQEATLVRRHLGCIESLCEVILE